MRPKPRRNTACLLLKRPLCCYLIGFSLESVDVTRSVDGAINGDHDTYHFPTVFAKLSQLLL